MTEEIKEILEYWKFYINELSNYKLLNVHFDDIKKVLDYITNLQQLDQDHKQANATLMQELTKLQEENEKLKELCDKYEEEHSNEFKIWKEKRHELLDYKSRCKKAIDKTQYIIDYGFDYDGFNTVESLKGLIDMLVNYARETKNILQGSEDNK